MTNPIDHEDVVTTLIKIKTSLRDIDMKLDHLIGTYHDKFFEAGESNIEEESPD